MDTPIRMVETAAESFPVLPVERADDAAASARPRLTVLIRNKPGDVVEKLAEFNAFDIVRLAPGSDARRINATHPMVISVFAENDDELVGICKQLLMSDLAAPLVVMTPELDSFREALLLEMGASDVISLNRGWYVAVARIRGVVQAAHERRDTEKVTRLHFGRLAIDLGARSVRYCNNEIRLTTAEFNTLWILAKNAGRPVTRTELQSPAPAGPGAEMRRFVDYRINRLRKRMCSETGQREKICTVRATGYMFSTSDW